MLITTASAAPLISTVPTASTASAAGRPKRDGGPPGRSPGERAGRGDVASVLRALPGLRVVEERPGAESGDRFFVLGLRQRVDHTDPAAGTFEQRLTLLHTAVDRPMVLATTGYHAVLTPWRAEPTVLLGANQLQIEHRYFGTSRPATLDHTHLTIRQAADDHHRVVRLFRDLYPGSWISAGGSKGGMAAVYHRRFHPHDVDGTVAYGAPNNVDDRDDSAYVRFLDSVGSAEHREAVQGAQRRILLRRDEMVARYEGWAAGAGDTFRLVGSADKALEIAVVRAQFMFWQRAQAADLAALPGPDATSDELYDWLDRTTGLSLYADSTARNYIPYWYQCGTQLGYPEVPAPHLTGLLRYRDHTRPRTFVPRDIPMRFDSTAMPDIDRWVRRRGSRLLFVNGTMDPSVAEPFRPGGPDSRVLHVPGGNHSAKIENLPPADRAQARATLARWARCQGVF
ncbi:S28 family serine protease [Streptomyces ferrugineus]|nr:S28 family serine protease [Streptomyces ferrugineus]